MAHRILFSAAVFALGLALAGHAQEAPGTDPRVLLDREQQRVALLTSGQYDKLAEMLSPTLSYSHSNGAIDTKGKFLADLRSGQVTYRSLTHKDVSVRFVAPDVAILNGVSDVLVTVGGQDQKVPLRFTIVYVRKNGDWLFEAWHSARRAG